MIARALAAALAAAALVPAAAEAAVTRPVQALDTRDFRTIWTPRNVPAQVGDTVEWRLTQPGNPNASTHDIWVVPPGGTARFLGASYTAPKATATVDEAGTWRFYCSIHGGLAPGGMNGQVVVGTADPGPPRDPGQPWTDPDWEDPEAPTGPPPLPNDTTAPTAFEEGDNTPPELELLTVKRAENAVRVTARTNEGGTLTLRLKRGRRVVATEIVAVNAGETTARLRLPARVLNRPGRYRLLVWATDAVELDSTISRAWVVIPR